MTRDELAALLNNREHGSEIEKSEETMAMEAGLVVVFGYSDDNVELRGAISEELGGYGGTTFAITREGLPTNRCRDDDCPYFAEITKKGVAITAVWRDVWHNRADPNWTFDTDIQHSTFMIMEGGEPFCRGIVFALADVTSA
jgi:hypothetical protein